jgi:hypothetical protein
VNQHTLILIVVGCAATGVIYYLWKKEQVKPPTSSVLGTDISTGVSSAISELENFLMIGPYNAGVSVGNFLTGN